MQVFQSGGFPIFGKEFSKDWKDTIREANPEGFFESVFRAGVYYRSNPDPKSGRYIFPEQSRNWVVKVFIPGVIRSDLAFLDKAIITMRPFREYESSVRRLYALERASQLRLGKATPYPHPQPTPWLEWWTENFSILSDLITRRYPSHMVSYAYLLQDPEKTVHEVFKWLGEGNASAGAQRVRPELRTQHARVTIDGEVPGVAPPTQNANGAPEPTASQTTVFDELFAIVHERKGLTESFIDRLNALNQELEEPLTADKARLRKEWQTFRQALKDEKK